MDIGVFVKMNNKLELELVGFKVRMILFLVSTAGTTSSCTFEFTSLGTDQRFNMRTWFTSGTEVTVGFPCSSSSLEKQSVLSSRSFQSQLIQSHDFSSCLENTFTGLLGNVESGNLKNNHLVIRLEVKEKFKRVL